MNTFKYVGHTYKNCSPSSAQQGALKSDQSWQSTITNAYSTVFGAGTAIFNSLKGTLQSIIASPSGYSAADLAAQRSQSINAAAGEAKDVNQAIGAKAATSGVVPGAESGVTQAERAGADTSILNAEASRESGITQANDQLKIQQQNAATKELEALPGAAFDPSSKVAGEVTSAEAQTSAQANANAATSDQWIGLVGGLADAAVGGLTSGGLFGKKPSAPGGGGNYSGQGSPGEVG